MATAPGMPSFRESYPPLATEGIQQYPPSMPEGLSFSTPDGFYPPLASEDMQHYPDDDSQTALGHNNLSAVWCIQIPWNGNSGITRVLVEIVTQRRNDFAYHTPVFKGSWAKNDRSGKLFVRTLDRVIILPECISRDSKFRYKEATLTLTLHLDNNLTCWIR